MIKHLRVGFLTRGIVYYQRALKRRYKTRLAVLRRRLHRAESIPQREQALARIEKLTQDYKQEISQSQGYLY